MLSAASTPPPYLGIKESVTGRRWQGLSPRQDRLSLQIAQHCGIPAVLARALARRNLRPHDVSAYLDPRPIDPAAAISDLADLDRAADRLVDAIGGHETIALVANSGIDGCCAMTMMQTALQTFTAGDVRWTVRYRAKPATDPIGGVVADHDLIFLLDLGAGLTGSMHHRHPCDIVIVDNDASDPRQPDVYAHVNGNRHDESGHYADLCTAGLTYLLLCAVSQRLRSTEVPGLNLASLSTYVCLACAAERVPLHANNRPFVLQGLEQLRHRTHPGFRALADTIPLRQKIRFHDLRTGFATRMAYGEGPEHDPLTARLLDTTQLREAAGIATVLDQFHADGLPACDQHIIEACDLASSRRSLRGLVWAASHAWPLSQLEAIAGALQETFNWPALAIRLASPLASGVGVGLPGFDLGTAIVNCRGRGLAVNGGGHAMKAALTMPLSAVTSIMALLGQDLNRQNPLHESRHDVRLDGVVLPEAVNFRLVRTIDRAGPFGIGSPRPRFALTHQQILKRRKYGTGSLHLEMCNRSGSILNGFVPGGYESDLGAFLRRCGRAPVHLAGTVSMGRSGGRKAQFNIEDAARV